MANIAFVVHRYAPYPGGSENYVQWMAEECLSRGHTVTVYAGQHKGDLNGVKVLSDFDAMLRQKCHDLVVVHGSGVQYQDIFLSGAAQIESNGNQILFLPILSRYSPIEEYAIHNCSFYGYSTSIDVDMYNRLEKSLHKHVSIKTFVPHGIPIIDNKILMDKTIIRNAILDYVNNGRSKKYENDTEIFFSCGGFWENKDHLKLADIFNQCRKRNQILIITGYGGDTKYKPEKLDGVFSIVVEKRNAVLNYMNASDCYIMSSKEEGFGLTLLEASMLEVNWISTPVAGALQLAHEIERLPNLWQALSRSIFDIKDEQHFSRLIAGGYKKSKKDMRLLQYHILDNRTIKNTVDGIVKCRI